MHLLSADIITDSYPSSSLFCQHNSLCCQVNSASSSPNTTGTVTETSIWHQLAIAGIETSLR